MRNQRKKWLGYLLLVPLAVFLTVGSGKPLLVTKADNNEGGGNATSTSLRIDEINHDQEGQEEGDLHDAIAGEQEDISKIRVPDFEEDSIITYSDAVNVLQQYQTVLGSLQDSTTSTSTLTSAEQALLSKLMDKHKAYFNSRNARITELSSQINDLLSVLAPLGDKVITSNSGLRRLLLRTMENIHDQLEKLAELTNLDFEIVDNETL